MMNFNKLSENTTLILKREIKINNQLPPLKS